MEVEGKVLKISNWNKPLYPNGIKKGQVIEYYQNISEWILPHLRNRPLVMVRFPDGIEKSGFFEKNRPKFFPDWVGKVTVKRRSVAGTKTYAVCNDKASLVYLANLACLEFHTWMSTADDVEKPNQIRIDLDPSKAGTFDKVKDGALRIKEILDLLKLKSFVMTSGGKGLHIVVPIRMENDVDFVSRFSKRLVTIPVHDEPKKYTLEFMKEKRKGRIFLDYHRNAYAQTAIAPYSTRARDGAPIAVPISWDELDGIRSPGEFNINNIFERLGSVKDPWKGFFKLNQSINKADRKLAEILSG